MQQHPLLYEALDAHRRALTQHLFNPDVRLIDIGWKIKQSERRIERGVLCVRAHKRWKPRGVALERSRDLHPERYVDAGDIGFPLDIVEAPYRLDASFGFALPQLSAPPASSPVIVAASSPSAVESLPRRGRYRPLRGGVSGIRQFGTAATLGGCVRDRTSGVRMILSNYHVLAGSASGSPGLPTLQPSAVDGGWQEYSVATYERDAMIQGLDAAVATLHQDIDYVNDQVGLGPVTGLGEPQLDMRVTKSGRTTGVTSGTITGFLGEGVLMSYGGFSTVIRHVWHIDGAGVSRGGDSGSWYLSEDTHQAVGLHFAGSHSVDGDYALMLTMSAVLNALNVDVDLGGG